MTSERRGRTDLAHLRLPQGKGLTTVERVGASVFATALLGMDLFGIFFTPGVDVVGSALSITATAAFLLYLWRPAMATTLLGVVFVVSAFVGKDSVVLFAAAIAAAMVIRLGGVAHVLLYGAGFLIATAVVAYGATAAPVNVAIYLLVAAVVGAVGFALRLASARGEALQRRLDESAEQERQAVLAERRWIAGELHDSIAHHLTVVALHVQMLDDPQAQAESQDAIRIAARKAMADLRFVIELAEDRPRETAVQTSDLETAISEARAEIEAAGHPVVLDGSTTDERIPRIAEIVLARIVRESTTNILKYAGPGDVTIRVITDDETIALTMRSPLAAVPRRDLPSSGTGLNRMAERVLGASGEFSSGPQGDHWQVFARLPVA